MRLIEVTGSSSMRVSGVVGALRVLKVMRAIHVITGFFMRL